MQPSSYKDYLGEKNTEWVYPSEILSYFSEVNPKFSYASFIQEGSDDKEATIVNELALEEDDQP